MDTKLTVYNENGSKVEIDVIDIFSEENKDKEYIIYSIGENIYASILIEGEKTFKLETITDNKEKALVEARIEQLISE